MMKATQRLMVAMFGALILVAVGCSTMEGTGALGLALEVMSQGRVTARQSRALGTLGRGLQGIAHNQAVSKSGTNVSVTGRD